MSCHCHGDKSNVVVVVVVENEAFCCEAGAAIRCNAGPEIDNVRCDEIGTYKNYKEEGKKKGEGETAEKKGKKTS